MLWEDAMDVVISIKKNDNNPQLHHLIMSTSLSPSFQFDYKMVDSPLHIFNNHQHIIKKNPNVWQTQIYLLTNTNHKTTPNL